MLCSYRSRLSSGGASNGQAPDVTGSWEITVKWETGSTLQETVRFSLDTSTPKLKASRDTFTGDRKIKNKDGLDETEIWVMTLADMKVRFVLDRPITSCEGALKSADHIEGTCTFGPFTKGPFTAERKKVGG